jgi:hypothetical protein
MATQDLTPAEQARRAELMAAMTHEHGAMANIHWLYPAFGAYCREHHLTADEAIERLQEQYPSLPVALIVRAQGDTARIAELLAQDEAASHQGQSQQRQGEQQQSSSNRQRDVQTPARDPQDFTVAVRARAGVGASSLSQPREAITGQKGEYDPAVDPFRARFAQRSAGRTG